jgi:transcriptional regulator with XRE-family HTH domain
MDLIKIGKYIAEKRKALGLTQKQLAEKLNMSDKSVSKWERGICLPDVSIYMELCSILRISINEFLAGEDIGAENVIEKSDSNLIQITKESKKKQKKFKNNSCCSNCFCSNCLCDPWHFILSQTDTAKKLYYRS